MRLIVFWSDSVNKIFSFFLTLIDSKGFVMSSAVKKICLCVEISLYVCVLESTVKQILDLHLFFWILVLVICID